MLWWLIGTWLTSGVLIPVWWLLSGAGRYLPFRSPSTKHPVGGSARAPNSKRAIPNWGHLGRLTHDELAKLPGMGVSAAFEIARRADLADTDRRVAQARADHAEAARDAECQRADSERARAD
jgi:hypothetical protein